MYNNDLFTTIIHFFNYYLFLEEGLVLTMTVFFLVVSMSIRSVIMRGNFRTIPLTIIKIEETAYREV